MQALKYIGIILLLIIVSIAFAGMFKFNILADLDGYDIDGNKIQQEYGYIIEEEVNGAEECTEFETFDAERSVCYFECDTEAQCDAIEARIDTALDELDDEYVEFSKNFVEFEGNFDEMEEKAELIYAIHTGEHFVVMFGTEHTAHRKIKKWLSDISPDAFSDRYLGRLILLTDTDDDSAAFVELREGVEPQKWDIFVNMESLKEDGDKEMVFTLIHEYAHILTLNESQLAYVDSEQSCITYFVDEGCLYKDSYLNTFYQKYWKGKFDVRVEDSDINYFKNPSAFVTEYAATNPAEDIAESFASFVFKKENNMQTIAGQKTTFFYEYPELVIVRNAIRDTLIKIIRKNF